VETLGDHQDNEDVVV